MNTSTRRLLAVMALLVATLCASAASPKVARKAVGPATQTARETVRINGEAPASVDVDTRDGNVVGVTAVNKDGSRMILKAQSKPTCAASCPAGQKLTCWEDEKELMTICVCGSDRRPNVIAILVG